MPSTHSLPGSLRDQYTALSNSSGTVSGAEPGEKQSDWSRELSVTTLLSLVQPDGQKVESHSLECKEDVRQLSDGC